MERFKLNPIGFFLVYAIPLLFYFSSLQAEQSTPLLASGYFFDGLIRRPLLIQSLNLGNSWQYPVSIHEGPVPKDFLDGGVSKATCNNSLCIATGNYYNSEQTFLPLVLQSRDQGLNWRFEENLNQKLPADFKKGWFNDSICKEKGCIAVGLYENSTGQLPLLAISDIQGNWSYSSIDKQLPANLHEGWFNSVSCKGKTCIAAGTYLDKKEHRQPLILVSLNNGLTWEPAHSSEVIAGIENPDAHLFGSTCESEHCVAVGEFTDPLKSVTPLLLQSSSKGQSWNRPVFSFPNDFISGWFNAVDCKAGFCIAVGNYNNGEIIKPLLVFSADGGAQWKYQETAPDSDLGTHLEYGSYMSASCSKMGCVAGGSFSNYFNTYPLITFSHDKGLSWQSPPSARTSVPAAELGNGYFGKVSCLEKTCIAAGDYTINEAYYPLLALSKDGGITWDFPESINNPETLPSNFLNGHF
ncbi:MAG: hypothetical protein H0U57_12985 [Tatlockia sp.]|nr:hypothetical protein [Tatlockia sp.]